MIYEDRRAAGEVLAEKLADYANRDDVIILGLPRGGVPVAFEVALELHAPLDVFIVRKLGVPGHEELAMGALASNGTRILNSDVIDQLNISDEEIESVTVREREEIKRRQKLYQSGAPPELHGRIVILVDDGLATGATMMAAVEAARMQEPDRIVVAIPVASPATCEMFREHVDQVVCAAMPEPFYAVGAWYRCFPQTSDDEVRALLKRAKRIKPTSSHT